MVLRSLDRSDLFDPNYNPEHAVTEMTLTGPEDSSTLTLLVPPWHGAGKAYDRLAKRVRDSGSAVLRLEFDDYILSPDIDQVVASFGNIQQTVSSELYRLVKEKQYRKVYAIASSLGNVALCRIARSFPFSGATMLVAGSNLARSMWEGARTKRIREHLEQEGINIDNLEEAWHGLDPKTNASAFVDKPVRLVVSSTDRIIPSIYQRELAGALHAAGASVTQQTTRLGHYSTVGKFCWFGEIPQHR